MSVPAGVSAAPRAPLRRRVRIDIPLKWKPLPLAILGVWLCLAGSIHPRCAAADLAEAETLFRTGRYEECAKLAEEEVESGVWAVSYTHLTLPTN